MDELTVSTAAQNGDIFVTETNGLSNLSLSAGTGNVTLTLNDGSVVDTDNLEDIIAKSANVTVSNGAFGTGSNSITTNVDVLLVDTTGANGDQFISEVSGLSGFNLNAKEGNITLTAGGAILDSDNDVDVTANIANLTVTGGIGENLTKAIQGNIDALVFSNNGTGSVFFNQVADGGNLTVSGKNTAESQNIFIKVQGDNAVLTVAAQDLKSANGIISLTADDMDILGNVDAGSSYVSLNTNNAAQDIELGNATGSATRLYLSNGELDKISAGTRVEIVTESGNIELANTISAGTGYSTLSLRTTNGTITDVTGKQTPQLVVANLELVSGNGIGNVSANGAVDLAVGNLSAYSQSGSIYLTDTEDLTLKSITGPDYSLKATGDGANVSVVAEGNVFVESNIEISNGALLLEATNGGIDVVGGQFNVPRLALVSANSINISGNVDVLAANVTGAGNGFEFTDANGLTIGSVTVESETVTGITTNGGSVTVKTNDGNLAINSNVTTNNGAISFTAESVGNRISIGTNVVINAANTVVAQPLDPAISLVADDISIDSSANVTTNGTVFITPFTAGTGVTLGGDTTGTLGLTDEELDTIHASNLLLGSNETGDVTVANAVSIANVNTLVQITSNGDITSAERMHR